MIYAALFWCPKAKGYKFRPPQCHAVLLALSAPVKCLPAMRSSNCWACISIAPCKNKPLTQKPWEGPATMLSSAAPPPSHWERGCSTPGFSSVSHSMCGAYGVKSNSFNSCQRLQRSELRLSTYLGPNYQNGDAQDCKSKNEVCSKADSELHAVLVQCVFAMPLLSCRYIV